MLANCLLEERRVRGTASIGFGQEASSAKRPPLGALKLSQRPCRSSHNAPYVFVYGVWKMQEHQSLLMRGFLRKQGRCRQASEGLAEVTSNFYGTKSSSTYKHLPRFLLQRALTGYLRHHINVVFWFPSCHLAATANDECVYADTQACDIWRQPYMSMMACVVPAHISDATLQQG